MTRKTMNTKKEIIGRKKEESLPSRIKKDLNNHLFVYLMALPGMLVLFVFNYVPLSGLLIAFKDFNISKGIFGSEWVGLQNFMFFIHSGSLGRVLFNTLFLNVLFIVFTTVFAVVIALFLNEIRLKIFKRVSQSVIFLPFFMSWIVVSMMLTGLLGGETPLINDWFGIEVNWYMEAKYWPWILTVMKIWHDAGYFSIIYLAAITAIPEDYYEAGRIDGASRYKLMLRITLPLLLPTITILTLLAVGRIFYGDFAMIYAVVGDNGILFPTTDVIDTYVFRALRKLGDLGMAAAVGLIQSVIGFILVLTANAAVKRYSKESSLF